MKIVRTTPCRACGKPLLFIGTRGGKTMPVDAEPVRFVPDMFGKNLYLVTGGDVVHGSPPREGDLDIEIGYVSHFATCTNPDYFRKRGKKARKSE